MITNQWATKWLSTPLLLSLFIYTTIPVDAHETSGELTSAPVVKSPLYAGKGPIIFEPVSDADKLAAGVSFDLGNAVLAYYRENEIQVVDVFGNQIDTIIENRFTCSGTVIGERTILTAAHCVDAHDVNKKAGVREVKLVLDSGEFELKCAMAKPWVDADIISSNGNYNGRDSGADYALCRSDEAIPESDIPIFENISLTPLQFGDQIFKAGFGCTSVCGTIGVNPNGSPSLSVTYGADNSAGGLPTTGYNTIEGFSGILALTKSPALPNCQPAEPTICPGDSGGPGFRTTNNIYAENDTDRHVVWVNHAIWTSIKDNKVEFSSAFAPLSATEFRTFMRKFQSTFPKNRICGVNDIETDRCR